MFFDTQLFGLYNVGRRLARVRTTGKRKNERKKLHTKQKQQQQQQNDMKEEKISFHFGNFMKLSCISYVANESVCECLSPCAYLSFPFVHKQMARCVCVCVCVYNRFLPLYALHIQAYEK